MYKLETNIFQSSFAIQFKFLTNYGYFCYQKEITMIVNTVYKTYMALKKNFMGKYVGLTHKQFWYFQKYFYLQGQANAF